MRWHGRDRQHRCTSCTDVDRLVVLCGCQIFALHPPLLLTEHAIDNDGVHNHIHRSAPASRR